MANGSHTTNDEALYARIGALLEGEQLRILARPGIGLTTHIIALARQCAVAHRVAVLRVKSGVDVISLRLLEGEGDAEPHHVPLPDAFAAIASHQPHFVFVDDLDRASPEHLALLHEASEQWLILGSRVVWGIHWTESEHDGLSRIPGRLHATVSVPPCSNDTIHEILLNSAALTEAQLAVATAACCGNPTVARRIGEELSARVLPNTTPPTSFATKAIQAGLFSVIGSELTADHALLFTLLSCTFPLESAGKEIADALGIPRSVASDMCDHLAYLALLTPDADRTRVVRQTLAKHIPEAEHTLYEAALTKLCGTLELRDTEAILDIGDGNETISASLKALSRTGTTEVKAEIAQRTVERLASGLDLTAEDVRALEVLGRSYMAPALAVLSHAARESHSHESHVEAPLSSLSLPLIFESSEALGPALIALIEHSGPTQRAILEAWAVLCPARHLGVTQDEYRRLLRRVIENARHHDAPVFVRAVACAMTAAHGVCPNHALESLEHQLTSQPPTEDAVASFQLLAFVHCARGNRSESEQWLVKARSAIAENTVAGSFTTLLRAARYRIAGNDPLSPEQAASVMEALKRVGAMRLAAWSAILGAQNPRGVEKWNFPEAHPVLSASYTSQRGALCLASGEDAEGVSELYRAGRIMASTDLCPLVFGNWREPLLKFYLENKARSAYRCVADDNFRCQLRFNRVVGHAPNAAGTFDSSLVPPSLPAQNETTPGLTAAEERVVREVVAGASNQMTAHALFLSKRTVDTHLRNVYRKLGIRSRSELQDLVKKGALTLTTAENSAVESQAEPRVTQ